MNQLSNLRPYKFLVIPVVQVLDEDETVLQEVTPEQPIPVFGIEGLKKFAENFEAEMILPRRNSRVVMPDDTDLRRTFDRTSDDRDY